MARNTHQQNPNKIASLIYNFLIGTSWLANSPRTSALWWKIWQKGWRVFTGPVTTKIHRRKVVLDFGHVYPIYSRLYPTYNNPLIQLVYECFSANKSAITLVDVGANIGDTILLLDDKCPHMVGKFYCIEGDPEFFAYLQQNLAYRKDGELFLAVLSSSNSAENELVRTRAGTGSAQGKGQTPACTLDSIFFNSDAKQIDVLKIDVDGLDGKVLLGATRVLHRYQPAVIFEWHPLLCQQTGNSWTEHFEILEKAGYSRFIWFDKFGKFSHFTEDYDKRSIRLLAELCQNSQIYVDWHYDVVALPPNSSISPVALAELAFAKASKSHY